MPFKMKKMICVGSPMWVSALLAIMRLFMSKKIAERLANLYEPAMHTMIGSSDAMPLGYCGGTGTGYAFRYSTVDEMSEAAGAGAGGGGGGGGVENDDEYDDFY
jgi:hypothetical protein